MIAKILALVLFVSVGVAEVITSKGVSIGLTTSNQDWDGLAGFETEQHLAYGMGFFVEWNFLPHHSLGLVSEIFLEEKGMVSSAMETTESDPVGTGREVTFNFYGRYLSIPLMLKHKRKLGSLSYFLMVGPRVDILLSTEARSFFDHVTDDFKKVDFGVSLGVGADLKSFGRVTPSLSLRYSPTFSNSYESRYLDIQNRSFEFLLSLGY